MPYGSQSRERAGSAAVALVIVVIGFAVYRMFLHTDLPANAEVRHQLELNLQSELAAARLGDVATIGAAIDQGDTAAAAHVAGGLMERRIEIGDLAMRGSGDDIVIKAAYTIHGPEGTQQRVGYLRYSHSPITGWRYRRETTKWSWYLTLF